MALYWEPCGDEACLNDGEYYACGMSDNRLYLGFIRQPQVREWIDHNGLGLGSSDESARHWLIADAYTGELFTAPVREAHAAVRLQLLPGNEEGQPATCPPALRPPAAEAGNAIWKEMPMNDDTQPTCETCSRPDSPTSSARAM